MPGRSKPADAPGVAAILGAVVAVFVMAGSAGCRTAPPLPAVDLSQPGWRSEQGQALWTPAADEQEIAGDLLLLVGPGAECLVQFAKTPFPLVTARQTQQAWQIEFGTAARRLSGRGDPRGRWVWLELARVRRGAEAHPAWSLEQEGGGAHCRLTNLSTGERLDVWFSP